FDPVVGTEERSGFRLDRVRRLPVAVAVAPGAAPGLRLAPGSIEIGGVEVAKGRPLISRPFANGPAQVLIFDSVDPQNADLAIVTDAQGNKYRISLAEVRVWIENTGVKPGEQVTALPCGTEVQDKKSGKTYIVIRVNPDGTVMCSQQSNSGRINAQSIPYKQLRVLSFSLDENVTPAPIGPSLRRVLAAGDQVVVLSGGRLQEGWTIRRNPRTNQLEAYNAVTRLTAPIDPNTVFHPGDFSEKVPALEGKPETVFLRRKFEYLNTPGRLPLSNRSFQRLFPPDGDFSQQNVGNCYLLAALHSLRQSPHFEVLVRSAITPISQDLEVPDPANRGRTKVERFTVGFDVRIPLGDPNGRVVRVNYDDLEGGQQTVNNLYLAVEGPVGFQILEAAYTLALHGRDREGQINRKASRGGQSEEALLELIGQQAGLVSRIGGSDDVLLSDQGGRTTQQVTEFFDNYSPDKYLATASSLPGDTDTRTYTARDAAGNRVQIFRKHAYSIESIDRNAKTVTVVNPHDTSAPMVFTYDGFMKAFRVVKIVEINHRQILR
ncbi:MAG TPA: hypothetical protein PKV72_00680, partial [Candidatus Peribacteria bacterium]|nr:hypothetical protein [Candidatus Peribacteria bacterium]